MDVLPQGQDWWCGQALRERQRMSCGQRRSSLRVGEERVRAMTKRGQGLNVQCLICWIGLLMLVEVVVAKYAVGGADRE